VESILRKVRKGDVTGQVMDPSEFRRVMGHFPTGVTVVTTRLADGRACGLTVNAFCSVSLEPPLVLVCVERGADSHTCISAAGYFAVNVLGAEKGESLSRRFATFGVDDKFDGIAYSEAITGAPVLQAAIAWADCLLREAYAGGDHTIFLGEVVAADAADGTPLVYYRGGYGGFTP
jgi:flavin reductase (DIM6/NTAB) family NADH-FMN oxidoreductase RutF